MTREEIQKILGDKKDVEGDILENYHWFEEVIDALLQLHIQGVREIIEEGRLPKTEDTGECKWDVECGKDDYYCLQHKPTVPLNKDSSENKEESMEDRFEKEFGNPEWIWKQEKYKSFIQSEISKAVAKERARIINKKHFEENMLDGDPVEDCGGAMIRASEVWEYLSLLNSKKGQHG